jgi:hypothetical protein
VPSDYEHSRSKKQGLFRTPRKNKTRFLEVFNDSDYIPEISEDHFPTQNGIAGIFRRIMAPSVYES